MNSLLQLLDILTALLGRWLKRGEGKEVQEAMARIMRTHRGVLAERFGAASGQLPDSPSHTANCLPPTPRLTWNPAANGGFVFLGNLQPTYWTISGCTGAMRWVMALP